MKYHEAIYMILDGGEAYRRGQRSESLCFRYKRLVLKNAGDAVHPVILLDWFEKTDWIVEKDGVVYEEYHPFVGKKEWFKTFSEDVSCPQCGSKILIKIVPYNTYACLSCSYNGLIYIKDRTHAQDEPAELEEDGATPLDELYKSYKELHNIINEEGRKFVKIYAEEQERKTLEEIKMPIIVDEVNEDWLEKKMLCFLLRKRIASWEDGKLELGVYKEKRGTCCRRDCTFCFSDADTEEKAQGTTVPADKVILYTCIHGTYPCEECYEKYKKENHIEQPREKVTVEHMGDLLQKIRGIAYKRGALRQAWLDADEMDYVNDFQQKLEYLVSLQGE